MEVEGSSSYELSLQDKGNYYIMSNGIVEVVLSKPGGCVTSIKYGGIDNLLASNAESNRGYWDLNWQQYYRFCGTESHVITNTQYMIELSFVLPSNSHSSRYLPMSMDIRYVMLRGSSGFYTYGIYKRESGLPSLAIGQTRVVFKLQERNFDFLAIGDTKQRVMPYPEDRWAQNSKPLNYPEAVILTNPKNPALKGEVDDKYQYSVDNRDNRVQGWISVKPLVGFWIITPSDEFKNGGPTKQNLTSHCGPTALSMFHSTHYAGLPLMLNFNKDEKWEKVFGPVFIYLNKASSSYSSTSSLWYDAKRQMRAEVASWPYNWPASSSYINPTKRASVTGTLFIKDSYISYAPYRASYAMLGLALPGYEGSWQEESKGYQFWTEADVYGNFRIAHVVPGTYDLYGWVPGVVGNYKMDGSITIKQGDSLNLKSITFQPPRNGPTVWEIGYPDRTANGFYIPDADHQLVNKLFVNQEKYRQYGLWGRYSDLYPKNDLVYTVNSSDWRRDWFFLHGLRFNSDGSRAPTTWKIKFGLQNVVDGNYTLHIAIASSHEGRLTVGANSSGSIFVAHMFGKDNAIARHGVHGIWEIIHVPIAAKLLQKGENTIYISQTNTYIYAGVMYDYLRLDAPPTRT